MHWFIGPVKTQYADFEGRTGRKDFWMYILVYFGLYIAVSIVGGIIGAPQVMMLFSLAVLVPNVAITARRLHDVNKSGWWQLIALIPVLGTIILIVWLARESKDEGSQYGASQENSPEGGETVSVSQEAPSMEEVPTEPQV